jgi:hypothetical protein
MKAIVKQKPSCRHCGAVLTHSLARCERCGKRSWFSVFFGGVGKKH